jgi:hypothetical protein
MHQQPAAVAVAEVPHVDQRTVRGFDGVARLEHGRAVVAHDLPVRAAGQDAPGQPRPGHLPADDVHDAPLAGWRAAERARRGHRDAGAEHELELRLRRVVGHGAPSPGATHSRAA